MSIFSQLYQILPSFIALVIAITVHEASHGFVAKSFGDDTAERLGRLTFNPIPHIDLWGTIVLPGLMLLSGVPFLFGYAKPVPVNFNRLHPQRLGMVLVAAAGPGINLFLAWLAAMALHINGSELNLGNEIFIMLIKVNVVLAAFNLLPLLPLDGGRILTGMLPPYYAEKFSRTEPYGMLILLGLIALPSLIFSPLGIYFDPIRWILSPLVQGLTNGILLCSGHGLIS